MGDQRAQMRIYDRYSKAMYNTAHRIVKHSAEAEDVMQEAFIKAFDKIDTFRGEVSFGAWLKRIVINQSIYRYRQLQRNRSQPLEDLLYKVAQEPEADSPPEQQRAREVVRAMQGLKENYRVALTLHLLEGYDYEEIATITGMSYANCRTTISRAKKSLRKLMDKE